MTWKPGRKSFNWATSFQKWIVVDLESETGIFGKFQLGHFFSEMDRALSFPRRMPPKWMFQLGHFFSEMDRGAT
jgi:hypothetical protein